MNWPSGVSSAGIACGIKAPGARDLGVLVFEKPVMWAGVFTRNGAAAAPVKWCRGLLGQPVRALVVNSGNANACTGVQGDQAVEATAQACAAVLGCAAPEVLVASTGPIGVQLPVDKITTGLATVVASLKPTAGEFAKSILTTDTKTKVATAAAGSGSIMGVAKGAAMLAPNMATMLAFIATDVAIDSGGLQSSLSAAVDASFNRLCIDACESTNDSVFLLSTQAVEVESGVFTKALTDVCQSLAEQMARDAEGGTILLRVELSGAADDAAADALARAVASSDLWRAAVHGRDPNWGRILAALGTQDRVLDLSAIELSINGVSVFTKGEPIDALAQAAEAMDASEVIVRCSVGRGPGSGHALTTDLSPDYVTLNATGTS